MEVVKYSALVLCKTLLKGGAEKQSLILSKLLQDKVSVTLVIWLGEKIDDVNLNFIVTNRIKYVPLKGNIFTRFSALIRLIRQQNVNLILSFLTLANSIAGITKLFNKNLLTIGGIRTEKLPFYKFAVEKFLHNRINDATVFNSYAAKTSFDERGFKPGKSVVVHNAIRILPLERNYLTGDEIAIVTVSRFVRSKDFSTSLKSFKRLLQNNKDRKLMYWIVGYGSLETEIRSMIRQQDLGDNVKVMISPADVYGILLKADIYLSTSLFEGLSNSIMEAMAAGLPIVATNVGDTKYLVNDSYNGFLVPPKDFELITSKLQELIDSGEKRKEFGKNSYSIIKNEFSEEKMLAGYNKLISEIAYFKA